MVVVDYDNLFIVGFGSWMMSGVRLYQAYRLGCDEGERLSSVVYGDILERGEVFGVIGSEVVLSPDKSYDLPRSLVLISPETPSLAVDILDGSLRSMFDVFGLPYFLTCSFVEFYDDVGVASRNRAGELLPRG